MNDRCRSSCGAGNNVEESKVAVLEDDDEVLATNLRRHPDRGLAW